MAEPRPDVVVVGGGIVGTATAAYLAAAGSRVVLVEREGIAAAASGRNSGIVQYPLDPVLATLHRETVALYRELESEAPARFALPAEPAGLLYVSHDERVTAALAEELTATHPELSPSFLDPDRLGALEPALSPGVSACRLAIGYPVAPAVATRAYAALAEDRGVRLMVGQGAGIVSHGGRCSGVVVGGQTIESAAVVVAAGPWTPGIVDPSGAWQPIRSLWGAVAEIELPDPPRHVLEEAEIDTTIEPGERRPDAVPLRPARRAERPSEPSPPRPDDTAGLSFSLVTVAGRSTLGSTFLDDEPDPAAMAPALVRHGSQFVGAIARARIIGTRRCARPLSRDGRPLVGALPFLDGLFVAAGHGPWGISTAPATARLVADLVLGRSKAPPDALDAARFG
ncbi:MAG: FAD-binding oxidoreductase, partial [Chloroflexota bacterium]|nr:FAD-binding oxidoreductase [Chloroflexota bacterium]